MKKIALFLLSLCVLLASLTACSGGRQHKTSTVKTVEFDDFVKKDSDEEGILGSFNLQDYLEAYGATVSSVDQSHSGSCKLSAYFENGIKVDITFVEDIYAYSEDCEYECGYLSTAIVYCASDNTQTCNFSDDYPNGIVSTWYKIIVPRDNGCTKERYKVVGSDPVYIEDDDEHIIVTVPDDFDEEFRKSVVPYLEIERPSYTADPLWVANK